MLINCCKTCSSSRAILSGGICWPPANVLDFTLTTMSSNWLRLTSTFFPLATMTSAKRSDALGFAGTEPLVGSAAARRAAAQIKTNEQVIRFINSLKPNMYPTFDQFNGVTRLSQIPSQLDNFHIGNIGVFIDLGQ